MRTLRLVWAGGIDQLMSLISDKYVLYYIIIVIIVVKLFIDFSQHSLCSLLLVIIID